MIKDMLFEVYDKGVQNEECNLDFYYEKIMQALNIPGVSSSYSINFGKHCKAKLQIKNGEPKVKAAINGWGDSISLSDITIEKL